MTGKYLAGVIQLNSSSNREANLNKAAGYIREAAAAGCALISLPEVFDCFCEDSKKYELAEAPENGSTLTSLKHLAYELKVWLICGSMIVRADKGQRVWNRSHLLNPQGELVAFYDKVHLFDIQLGQGPSYHESSYTTPGAKPVMASTPLGKIGLSICYDLRFPELYRTYSDQGATIISVPSAFTKTTGQDHWESLVRVRAIENQCYVLAPNQWGSHGEGRETWGHSMIVDPWGIVLACRQEGEGLIMAELNTDYQHEIGRAHV